MVEDNSHMRSLIRHMLTALNVQSVSEAANGDDALAILRHERPHLVICDWDMESVDGLTFVRTLRRAKETALAVMPVLMLTSFSEREKVCLARDAGANDFLTKPVSINGLYQRIHTIMTKPRPFLHCPTYFGPDRRRRAMEHGGPERRTQTPVIAFRPKPVLL
jgi:DNA-binding response OmpR family regulator